MASISKIHADNPNRRAAKRRGMSRFATDVPCLVNPDHLERYVSSGKCACCVDDRNLARSKERAAERALETKPTPAPKTAPTPKAVVKPMIGFDEDLSATERKLAATTDKFLTLLRVEKLAAIRAGIA